MYFFDRSYYCCYFYCCCHCVQLLLLLLLLLLPVLLLSRRCFNYCCCCYYYRRCCHCAAASATAAATTTGAAAIAAAAFACYRSMYFCMHGCQWLIQPTRFACLPVDWVAAVPDADDERLPVVRDDRRRQPLLVQRRLVHELRVTGQSNELHGVARSVPTFRSEESLREYTPSYASDNVM